MRITDLAAPTPVTILGYTVPTQLPPNDLPNRDIGQTRLQPQTGTSASQAPANTRSGTVAKRPPADARLLYTSPYLRGLTPDQVQVSIATNESGNVLVAWDEPPLEQVAMAISSDGGETWSDIRKVDNRQPDDGSGRGPSHPWLAMQGNLALLVWQAGHEGNACGLYYQSSINQGLSWSKTGQLPAPFDTTCGSDLQFLEFTSGYYLRSG